MIKILLKKQLAEIFKAYFFDMKNNKARSKVSTVLYFSLFTVLMVFIMGGMFGGLGFALSPIISLGFGWLYFAMFALISVLFGVFGSVFSTYSGLYLAKDNDLILSLPIPVSAIITSRLLGVYLMGLLYSSVVIIPAAVIYFIFGGISISSVLGTLVFIILISLFVLALSCIFGYLVAKVSLKLKNKSFITVLISLVFFALYYFVYFKASAFLSEFINNVVIYGDKIKNNAYPLYIIGRAAEGDVFSSAVFCLAVLAVLFITLYIISRSFLKIAASSNVTAKVKYKQKKQKSHSLLGTLVLKELKRFTSSPNYMLNCGLGIVFLIAAGVFVLIKISEIRYLLYTQFPDFEGAAYVGAYILLCLILSMNDIAAPSVSLEGKTLWQIRSLPVPAKTVIKSKWLFQTYINILPAVFFAVCVIIALLPDILTCVLFVSAVAVYVVFFSLFSIYCGLHKVNLNWTNEIIPIKQGMNVLFAIFGGWGYAIASGGAFLVLSVLGILSDARIYILILLAVTLALSSLIYRWLNQKGVRIFESL